MKATLFLTSAQQQFSPHSRGDACARPDWFEIVCLGSSGTDRSGPGAWPGGVVSEQETCRLEYKRPWAARRGSVSVCQPKMTPSSLLWLLITGASLRLSGESLGPVTCSLGGGWLITKAAVSWDNKHWLSALWNTWAGVLEECADLQQCLVVMVGVQVMVPLSGTEHIGLTIRCLSTWLIQALDSLPVTQRRLDLITMSETFRTFHNIKKRKRK